MRIAARLITFLALLPISALFFAFIVAFVVGAVAIFGAIILGIISAALG
jgi:hypothetical protein